MNKVTIMGKTMFERVFDLREVAVDEAPLRNNEEQFFPFHTRRFETSASYQWADKFSEPGDVPVSRNPRFKIQFLSATATTLKKFNLYTF